MRERNRSDPSSARLFRPVVQSPKSESTGVTRTARFRVRVQYPINLGQMSQPQPDLVLYRPGMWRGQHPGAADISLVVQISDSSLSFDLDEKLALYRASGIQEYWVVDLKATQVHRFVAPHFKGQAFRDSISPSAWPDIRIDLRELFAWNSLGTSQELFTNQLKTSMGLGTKNRQKQM